MIQVAGPLTWKLNPLQTPFCFDFHSDMSAFGVIQDMIGAIFPSVVYIGSLQSLKIPVRYCASFITGWNWNYLPFSLEGMSQHASDHWNPKICKDISVPWIFFMLSPIFSRACVLMRPLIYLWLLTHLYQLAWCHYIMDMCDVLRYV